MLQRLAQATLLSCLLLGASACSKQLGPKIASSAREPGYASHWATEVESASRDVDTWLGEVEGTCSAFEGFPAQLKNKEASLPVARELVERADEAGRAQAYVERAREVQAVRTFFEDKKDEIGKKVSGSVNYAAKKAGAASDVGSVALSALKESVAKETEKRLREGGDVETLLSRSEDALGKDDTATLERQTDTITRASYVVHIALPERQVQLQDRLKESSTVRGTLEDFLEEERAYQGSAKLDEGAKKASEARIAAAKKGLGEVDAATDKAKATTKELEPRVKKAQQDYTKCLKGLKKALDGK